MTDVLSIGAVSPLGVAQAAWSNGALGAPARVTIMRDEVLAAAGVRKPYGARAIGPVVDAERGVDPATTLLLLALSQILAEVPTNARLGVAIGTSSGGMASAELLYAAHARGEPIDARLAAPATYFAPFGGLLDRLRARGHAITRSAHVLTACSASTYALGLAHRWLDAGSCDLVIAGGYDALTTFVAAGFDALGATTASPPPRPFRLERDGMSLGEGACLFLLAASDGASRRAPLARIEGFGSSGDAVHLTAPDRTGGGLARAAIGALHDARVDPALIDLVSVHGTSTPFNDPMEARAIGAALGRTAAVVASKASIGHTLGAAGALESALVIDAIARGIFPATAGTGTLDPEVAAAPRERNEASAIRSALKLSAAFGGANASLVISGASEPPARAHLALRSAHVVEQIEIDATIDLASIAQRTGVPRERLARMDATAHLALSAVAALAARVSRERLRGAGIVVGTALATMDVNAIFDEGMRRRGAAHAEGRRFVYTTPNACAGECAIAFSLTGPNLAVGRGVDAGVEALEVARDLVCAGDVDRMVVVHLEAEGPVTRAVADALGLDVRFGARASLLEAC